MAAATACSGWAGTGSEALALDLARALPIIIMGPAAPLPALARRAMRSTSASLDPSWGGVAGTGAGVWTGAGALVPVMVTVSTLHALPWGRAASASLEQGVHASVTSGAPCACTMFSAAWVGKSQAWLPPSCTSPSSRLRGATNIELAGSGLVPAGRGPLQIFFGAV